MRSIATVLIFALPVAASAQILRAPATKTFTPVLAGTPPAPLTVSPSPTNMYLRWGCPPDASGYDVYATSSSGAQTKLNPTPIPGQCLQDLRLNTQLVNTTTYSLGYTHSGVTPGSSWTYVVVALYPNGAQGSSTPVAAVASLLPPPAGLSASVSGRNAVLQWNPVQSATGFYNVFRRLQGESAWRQLESVTVDKTSYTDGSVLPPGQHQYYVQANLGQPSPPVTVTGPLWPAPTISLSNLNSRLSLSWLPVSEARNYLVFRQREGEPGFTQLTATPVTAGLYGTLTINGSYDDQNPVMAQRHSYYVKAVDGEQSNVVSVVPGIPSFSQIVGNCGSGDLAFRYSGTGSGSVVQVVRGGTPTGPFYPTNVHYASPGYIGTIGNPTILQYYKIQATYPTGVLESIVIPIAVPDKPPPLFTTFFREVAPGVSVEWQCK